VRKPFEQLFFDVATGQPISEATAGPDIDLVQALRSGPTAMNKQPWRFGIDAAQIHIYNTVGTEVSWWDIGIGACNVAYFLNAKDIKPVYSEPAAIADRGHILPQPSPHQKTSPFQLIGPEPIKILV
jgi:nitroreductase